MSPRKSPTLSLLASLMPTILLAACQPPSDLASPEDPSDQPPPSTQRTGESDNHTDARNRMVDQQLKPRGIENERVLEAMRRVPRHAYVPTDLQHRAYQDSPLPIGQQQTISQPYIVALMTQLADPHPEDKALDVGTGSGYQAAVLAQLVQQVYSIEIVEPLAEQARRRLEAQGYDNIELRHGDGYQGWPSAAPFDIIIVAAAPDHLPPDLVDQLAPGGKLVIPVGDLAQNLLVVEKTAEGEIDQRQVAPVRFVPMTGKAEESSPENTF